MPRRLAQPARSAYEAVDRGLALVALVWQALWIAGDSRLWPGSQSAAAGVLAFGLVVVTWLLLLAWRVTDAGFLSVPSRWANVVALSATAGALLSEAASESPPDWGGASGMAVLSAGVAGLLLGSSVAIAWTVAVAAVEGAVILGVALGSGESWAPDILFPLYAMAVSVAMIAARAVLTHDAKRADEAAAALLAAEQARLTAEGIEATLHRQERLLHETVLNTLTAIVRGGITATEELRRRLRSRCEESVEVLRHLGLAPDAADRRRDQRLEHDVNAVLVELHASGTSVHLHCHDLSALPPAVYDAVLTATREALRNVLRHAEASDVRVSALVGDDDSVEVLIRDDGRGFALGSSSPGFGVRRSVIEGLAEVGGSARVEAEISGGTVVSLSWRPPPASADRLPEPSESGSAFAIPLLVSFSVFTLAIVLLTRDEGADLLRTIAAFTLFLGLAGLMAWASLRGPIPWWVVISAVVGGALIYRVQTSATEGESGPWTDWSSLAVISLFIVAAASGPRFTWLVVLASWFVIQGDILHEVLASGTAIIVSAAIFGRNVRRNEARVQKARSQQLQERTARAVAEEGSQRVRRRYEALRVSGAQSLLDGIGSGALDPDEEGARRWAALEERYIRTVMRVDPAVDSVHALAVELAGSAREVGLFLDVDVSAETAPVQPTTPGDRAALHWAVENSVPGGVGRFSARSEGGDYVLRLLTPIAVERHAQALTLPRPGLVLDPADSDMLWEIRAAQGETDARAGSAADTAGDRR